MHQLSIIFLLLLMFGLNGCKDKKESSNDIKHNIPIENTTQIEKIEKKKTIINKFTLKDTIGNQIHIDTLNNKVLLKENNKSITMVTFFASSCPPCINEIPYLNKLQKKYSSELFVYAILLHNSMKKEKLSSLIKEHNINYFISNSKDGTLFANRVVKDLNLHKNFPIPLTVIYVDGEYFTHYEGIVPLEMMEYDIKEAIKFNK